MELWKQLLSEPVGIASAIVIAATIIMGVYYCWYFITHMMKED